jgi:ABC-2 type transport system ATP-binding protein
MTTAAAIRVSGARKVYPAVIGRKAAETVHDVSFRVGRGEIHGLLGPNGAGKTTTLKMLLGLVRSTAGEFEVLGADPRRPAGRARIGFLPEQPYFNPQLTAYQALRLYARVTGVERGDVRRVSDELLDEVGLKGQGPSVLSRYSRGMLQRLGIAQAMLGEPEVLILDEPASGLDPVGQRDVREIMARLSGAGATILLSSHQLSEVEAVCSRVTILDRGRVAAEGPIEQLLRVAGRTSIRVRGLPDGLPPRVARLTDDVALSGGAWVFSVPEESAREVVDALDDAGASLEALAPKRESLEEYFSRLIADFDRADRPDPGSVSAGSSSVEEDTRHEDSEAGR